MAPHSRTFWLVVAFGAGAARAQDGGACYGGGSVALAIILSVVFTALALAALYVLWRKYRKRKGKPNRYGVFVGRR
jgi:membrane protein implicated in regulation of membrane protease activity